MQKTIGTGQTLRLLLPMAIILAAAGWLLPSLGNGMLWQDEAQTALLARTTLAHGMPIGRDGANSLSQEQGSEFGPSGLWKWHTWLSFYLLAGFYKCFGESTAVSRLPFALVGVGVVVLSYFTSLLMWRDETAAVVTSFLLLACIPFALLVRQCRYYSLCMFFTLLMLNAYIRICRGGRRDWIVLGLAGALLYHSHFLYLGTTFGAIVVHAAIWHRDRWKHLLLACLLTALFCAPHAVWLSGVNYGNYSHRGMKLHFLFTQTRAYLHQVVKFILPWPLLLIGAALTAVAIYRQRKTVPLVLALEPWALPVILSAVTILALVPTSPMPYFRYLAPILPPLMLLLGRWVMMMWRASFALGLVALVLLALWWPDRKYLYELRHHFVGPVEGIVQLLQSSARSGDVVVTSYDDLPIKFYTTCRVCGGLAGDDLSTAVGARWLILRKYPASKYEFPVRNFIEQQIKNNPGYHAITLTGFPDTKYENREDPDKHLYSTSTTSPPVVVYELIH